MEILRILVDVVLRLSSRTAQLDVSCERKRSRKRGQSWSLGRRNTILINNLPVLKMIERERESWHYKPLPPFSWSCLLEQTQKMLWLFFIEIQHACCNRQKVSTSTESIGKKSFKLESSYKPLCNHVKSGESL